MRIVRTLTCPLCGEDLQFSKGRDDNGPFTDSNLDVGRRDRYYCKRCPALYKVGADRSLIKTNGNQ